MIPCYNNLSGLIYSLASVKYHPDRFLVLIVDDGSKEPVTTGAIRSVLNIHLPLHILRNDSNQGITGALNTGLEWTRNNLLVKYIARLDAGDRCSPERFFLQVNYMDIHPEIDLLGSWCRFESRTGNTGYSYKTPLAHHEIVKAMHFKNVFIHPTVLFRASVLEKTGLYPVNFPLAEDYAFFWKILKSGQTYVLDKYLVTCEITKSGISSAGYRKQLQARQRVVSTYGNKIFLKMIGILRLKLLFILPKRLILILKQMKG